MIDAQNKWSYHLFIALVSTLSVLIPVWFFEASLSRLAGGVPIVILFLVMIIGPVMKLYPFLFAKWGDFPWNWRAELGIWFAVWAVIHTLVVFADRGWDVIGYLVGISPWAFGALVATVMAVILAALSFRGAINFLGTEAWKWLQNYFTYVIWWLTVVHIIDRALLRPGFPSEDPVHWIYLAMVLIVPILQTLAFIKHVVEYREEEAKEATES